MATLHKRIREIERLAGVQIIAIHHTGGGHLRLTLPNDRFVVASATPSCPFAIQHIIHDIRRTQSKQGGRHRAR